MLVKSLITLAAAVAVVGAVPQLVKRFPPPPKRAIVWVQETFGETVAYLAATGEAFHWADENGDPGAPPINKFDVHVYPGFPPGSKDVLVSLSNGNDTCRFTPDKVSVLNCRPKAKGTTATLRATYMNDPTGTPNWMIFAGHPTWSVINAPESGDQYWKVAKDPQPNGLTMGLYLQAPV